VPTRVAGNHKFSSLSAGPAHICGISLGRTESRCWGSDIDLAIGQGLAPYVVPIPYPTSGAHPFASVSAGDQFACGLATDRNVWCWGSNRAGQLGTHPLDGRRLSLFYSATPTVVGATVSAVQ
jgi:alpha-tubulin suppressor-like RCC1 family protein